jgi:BirA family biotin operon repressor/biotin-[acetyl-CoA-carboxylase] ligase
LKNRILELLKFDRESYISGEEICRILGVSRTAVWKHIQVLRDEGYKILSMPSKGYCLTAIPDRLYPEEIMSGLLTKSLGRDVRYFEIVDSTNNKAKELAGFKGLSHEAGLTAAEGMLVIAEEQTGGRGRLGRSWHAPYGKGIWMSVLLRPQVCLEIVYQMTMITAVAVMRAVREVCGIAPEIKWPNDLQYEGKKLCGILTEMSAEADRVNYIVVGIGINTASAGDLIPPQITHQMTSLSEITGKPVSRVKLVQEVLQELEACYDSWLAGGFPELLEEWKSHCNSLNRQVAVKTLHEVYTGWSMDVNSDGALLLKLDNGEIKKFVSGDVS